MSKLYSVPGKDSSVWRLISLTSLLIITGVSLMAALIFLQPSTPGNIDLRVGRVAPQDIMAPFSISFESDVLTEEQRVNAAQGVAPVFTSPNTQIARQQVDKFRGGLSFISVIREDEFASREQKLADFSLIEDNAINPDTAESILSLNAEQWQAVQQEAIQVLQQVMRGAIREEHIEDAKRSIPTLVSFSLPEEQAKIVSELVSIYVAPNSLFNEELTEEMRQQAREEVQPVERTFVRGETVVRRGKVLSEVDLEALQQLGLLPGEGDPLTYVNAGIMVVLCMTYFVLYLHRQKTFANDLGQLIYIGVLFLLFLLGARLSILGQTVLPFLYPVAGFGLLITALFGPQPGVIFSIPLSLLITYGMSNALELSVYYILSSIFGILMLGRAQRIISFFWAGTAVAAIGASAVLTFRLLDPFTDIVGLVTLSAASLANGLFSGVLAVLLLLFTGPLLGKTTIIQILELSRPDHPLLSFILMNAPGTYQHSLQVANLAEQAAERIGADPLLTRVGSLYHDAGKALNPQYFIENQIPGTANVHDNLTPLESSTIIIRHVTDGIELAAKHRLPGRIIDFIAEHHGTMVTNYQYINAIHAAGGDKSLVDIEDFRYPGPRPQSRETALVMLADGCEARARAERPATASDMETMIKEIIDKRVAMGQLDDTAITMKDLKIVLESFTATLKGVYHPRIEYPKLEHETVPSSNNQATQPAPVSPQKESTSTSS